MCVYLSVNLIKINNFLLHSEFKTKQIILALTLIKYFLYIKNTNIRFIIILKCIY